MERVRGRPAKCRRVRQRIDDLQLLDDRARPSVCDDDGQRILFLRTQVNEMNVNAVDSRCELWQGGESRLALAPVVLRALIAREILHCRELYALRLIVDDFPLGPLRRVDAPAQLGQIGVRSFETKWTNVGPITTPRLRDVTQCLRHGVNSPGKTE